jgi:hypothetical protein
MTKTSDGIKIIDNLIGSDDELNELCEQETINAHVVQLIYDARTEAGLSQKELAKMNTKQEIIIFLNELCADLGICDPLYNLEYFISKEYYEVHDFVSEIFLSEGLNPDLELKFFRQTKRRFIDRFGSSEVEINGKTSDW